MSNSLLWFGEICQALITPICIWAYVPQWRTLIRRKSSDDISLGSELLWGFASCLSLTYATINYLSFGSGIALLCTTVVNIACLGVTIGLISRYRRQPARPAPVLKFEDVIANLAAAEREVEALQAQSFRKDPLVLGLRGAGGSPA